MSISKESITHTSSDISFSRSYATIKVDMSKYPIGFRDYAGQADSYTQFMKIHIPEDFPVDKTITVAFDYYKGAQSVEEALHDLLHYNLRKIKQ
jgi:hypothetical protein